MRAVRIYHPDFHPSWYDRLYDGFVAGTLPARGDGVDWTLLQRAAGRTMRQLLDGIRATVHLGDEMVRVDTAVTLPADPAARRDLAGEIVRRLRVSQVLVGLRHPLPIRWVQFDDAPEGSRLLVRLLDRPNPGLRTLLGANTAEDASAEWAEVAVGE